MLSAHRQFLLVEAKSIGIAEDKRPFLIAIHYLFSDDLLVMDWLEYLVVFHLLQPLLEIAQDHFVDVDPSFLQNAVDEETNSLYAHIAHHQLIDPFVDNWLQIDVIQSNLKINVKIQVYYAIWGSSLLWVQLSFGCGCWQLLSTGSTVYSWRYPNSKIWFPPSICLSSALWSRRRCGRRCRWQTTSIHHFSGLVSMIFRSKWCVLCSFCISSPTNFNLNTKIRTFLA